VLSGHEIALMLLSVNDVAFGSSRSAFVCVVLEPGCSGVMLNRSVSYPRGVPVKLDDRFIDEGRPEVD
jgi:hypothetical protein